MNLHRIERGQPDWAGLDDNQLNPARRVAKATGGWGALASAAVTVWGLAEVVRGNIGRGVVGVG